MNENKTNINCDTGILGKIHLNPWKYWKNDIEIFTFSNNIVLNKIN